MTAVKICKIAECNKPVKAMGWCNTHYLRSKTHGCPLKTISTPPGVAMTWIQDHIRYSGDECLIWPFNRTYFGYPSIGDRGAFGTNRAHRVMCELFHGPAPEERRDAAHSCGVRLCMNPRHLRWASRSENEKDKIIHGKSNRGANHGMSKLTEDDIRTIRALGEQVSTSALAERFFVSRRHIRDVLKKRTWRWLN